MSEPVMMVECFGVHPSTASTSKAQRVLKRVGVKEVIETYTKCILKSRGFDISTIPNYWKQTDLNAVKAFVEKWGETNAKRIIETAFSDKFNGVYKDFYIGQSIFLEGSSWVAKMFLDHSFASSPDDGINQTDAIEDIGFRINYI